MFQEERTTNAEPSGRSVNGGWEGRLSDWQASRTGGKDEDREQAVRSSRLLWGPVRAREGFLQSSVVPGWGQAGRRARGQPGRSQGQSSHPWKVEPTGPVMTRVDSMQGVGCDVPRLWTEQPPRGKAAGAGAAKQGCSFRVFGVRCPLDGWGRCGEQELNMCQRTRLES